jgi:hypothetical protein
MAPLADPRPSPTTAGEQQLQQPEQPDSGELAGEQGPRWDRGEQHLDHPRRLLLHHPGGHGEAVHDELQVEQQRRREGHPLVAAVLLTIERPGT